MSAPEPATAIYAALDAGEFHRNQDDGDVDPAEKSAMPDPRFISRSNRTCRTKTQAVSSLSRSPSDQPKQNVTAFLALAQRKNGTSVLVLVLQIVQSTGDPVDALFTAGYERPSPDQLHVDLIASEPASTSTPVQGPRR